MSLQNLESGIMVKKKTWEKSPELLTKSKMISELIKFYPARHRNYLYNDFYKLTNFTLELLLKEKNKNKIKGGFVYGSFGERYTNPVLRNSKGLVKQK